MPLNLGEVVPNFQCLGYDRDVRRLIDLYQYLGDSWGIIASHPADYTPVCTSELGTLARMYPEFEKRGVKVLGLSCDGMEEHCGWVKDVEKYGDVKGHFPFPLLADKSRDVSVKLGMLDERLKDKEGLPLTCRALYIIGPDKTLKLAIIYPASTGRNFNELLRVIDSLLLTDKMKVATPSDWKQGDDCMILPSVSDEEAKKLFGNDIRPEVVPSGKNYIRKVKCPKLVYDKQ